MKTHSIPNHSGPAIYVRGFFLALLLTVLAFGIVIYGADIPFSPGESVSDTASYGDVINSGRIPLDYIVIGISILAIVQILVHLRFFLHLNFSSGQIWNVQAFAFTLLITLIMAGGTLWIMHDTSVMMMPHSEESHS
ncbi:cytochrome o ubiquinol oxidase subunit IV [Methylomarinum vadi]|uniref:cytochrome o ubiquinol oxidase subunit IV n=1 Tax=Methylomarinum vadi TaxID=438855 RepID=UPI00068C31E2|nr:cytochrome C oxidase subunit IV family protein [Methylomarinum vadi]